MPLCMLSLDAKMNYKIGGVAGAGSWVELDIVRNVTLGMERTEADATTRANGGWKASVGTLKEITVETEMLWDTADTGFNVIKQHFLDGTTIGIQVLDELNGEGIEADMIILTFPEAQEIEDKIMTTPTFKPTCSETEPQWVLGGTPSA